PDSPVAPQSVHVKSHHCELMDRWFPFAKSFYDLFENASTPMTLARFTALLLSALWSVCVWALFGGAICRIAALELTRGDKLDIKSSLKQSTKLWTAYFSAPLSPLAAVCVLSVPIAILGLFLRSEHTIFVTALLWPLALLAGV